MTSDVSHLIVSVNMIKAEFPRTTALLIPQTAE